MAQMTSSIRENDSKVTSHSPLIDIHLCENDLRQESTDMALPSVQTDKNGYSKWLPCPDLAKFYLSVIKLTQFFAI